MSISIIVKGADFSGANIGNAFFPSYANLVAARFYGTKIPDLTAYKKSKLRGPAVAGSATVAETNYGLSLMPAQVVGTGINMTVAWTLVAVIDPVLSSNVFRPVLGNNTGNAMTVGGGDFVAGIMAAGATRYLRTAFFSGSKDLISSQSVLTPAVLIFSYNPTTLTCTIDFYDAGKLFSDSITLSTAPPASGREVFMTWGSTDGTVGHRHVSLFDKSMDATERASVYQWLKRFYKAKGITL